MKEGESAVRTMKGEEDEKRRKPGTVNREESLAPARRVAILRYRKTLRVSEGAREGGKDGRIFISTRLRYSGRKVSTRYLVPIVLPLPPGIVSRLRSGDLWLVHPPVERLAAILHDADSRKIVTRRRQIFQRITADSR